MTIFNKLLLILIVTFLVCSCQILEKKTAIIYLDLSQEHDQGLFNPENGDQVLIAGNFNNWNTASGILSDENKDWIYTIDLFSISEIKFSASDTVQFNFYKRVKLETEAQEGYVVREKAGIRKMTLENLIKQKPTFHFNEESNLLTTAHITFTVGTANQQVLGFFNPLKGDQVVVSGNFCNWDQAGIALQDADNDSIYSMTIPVKYSPDRPIQYKYRILSKNTVIPDNGWENLDNRILSVQRDSVTTPYVEFNNMRRVIRFTINTAALEKSNKYRPLKGDVLQIKLVTDAKTTLSEPFMKVGISTYETAIVVPLPVKKIEWQLVRNLKQELTGLKEVEVGLNGKIIRF